MDWKLEFDTGLPEIDAQHRYFFEIIAAVERTPPLDEAGGLSPRLGALLEELQKYAQAHFAWEAHLMAQYGDPATELHRAEHVQVLLRLKEAATELQAGTMRPASFRLFLYNWFASHTTLIDRELARHVQRSRAAIGLARPPE